MSSIKLKKLLDKENIKAIEDTVKALAINILIKDDEDVIIYGDEKGCSYSEEYEIKLDGQVIGCVAGDNKTYCILSIINSFILNNKEKNKLAQETLEKYREINMIYNVSEKISAVAGVSNVARSIVTEAMNRSISTYATIMLVNEASGKLEMVCEFNKNISADMGKIHRLLNEDNSIISNVLFKKHGEIINSDNVLPGTNEEQCDLSAFIISPVVVKNKAIGVMIIGNHQSIEYTASDLKLCNSLALYAGVAIEGAKLFDSLRENFYDTLKILSQIIEMKDSYRNGHYKRIMNYSLNIAKAIDMPKVDQVKLKLAVMLHDIGNLSINDELLNKKGKFTEDEFEIIKKHSEIGAEMLENIDHLKEVVPIIRAHHENFDGTGYPYGLKGEEIPICSRIIALTDAFDAMTNDRPYKASMNIYFAADELKKNKGVQFDPKLVDTFFEIYKDKKLEEIQSYILND